jgi:hypothetical protein
MRIAKDILKVILVAVGALSLYFGVVQGEWAETMFNATLL